MRIDKTKGRRFIRRATEACLLSALFLAIPPTTAADNDPWRPQVQPLLNTYRNCDYAAVQANARAFAEGAGDPAVRRDASAIAALAMLHSDARADRRQAEAALQQLALEDPSLLRRGETLLALAEDRLASNEHAAALGVLEQAETAFEREGGRQRLAAVYRAMAEGWRACREWEALPLELGVARPGSETEALRLRESRMATVQEKTAALPDATAALRDLDLILAKTLLDDDPESQRAAELLERVAGGDLSSESVESARLLLAQRDEATGDFESALRRYDALAAAGARQADAARTQAAAIRRAAIELVAPGVSALNEVCRVSIRSRNLAGVRLEVRRVDLESWLSSRQGQFVESQLPTSGAVVHSAQHSKPAERPFDWGNRADIELDALAPGTYVVSAESTDPANPLSQRRLLVRSDLSVAAIVGQERAMLWIANPDAQAASAKFWMHGSFVPTSVKFESGVAAFSLPPEARVMRDRRWICVVTSGSRVAVCRGSIAAEQSATTAGRVATLGAPPRPRVGERYRVFGTVLDKSPKTLDIDLLDALDKPLQSRPAAVSAAGTFLAEFEIEPAMAGKVLHAVPRIDNRPLATCGGSLTLSVPGSLDPPTRMTPDMSADLKIGGFELHVPVSVAYDWGAPVSGGHAEWNARILELPASGPLMPWAMPKFAAGHVEFTQPGRAIAHIMQSQLELPAAPCAVGFWFQTILPDGRETRAFQPTIAGGASPYFWIQYSPTEPRVDAALTFHGGWYDPAFRVAAERRELRVRRGDTQVAALSVYPSSTGLQSAAWFPRDAGQYEADLLIDGVARATTAFLVSGRQSAHAAVRIREIERADSQLRIALDGVASSPLLAIALGTEPIAGIAVQSADSTQDAVVALPPSATRFTQGAVLSFRDGQFQIDDQAVARVAPPPPGELRIVSEGPPRAGSQIRVRVADAPGDVYLARLLEAREIGSINWASGQPRVETPPAALWVSLSDPARQSSPLALYGVAPDVGMISAMYEGAAEWIAISSSADVLPEFDVPLPAEPGPYRLLVTRWSAGGVSSARALSIDTRGGLSASVSVPSTSYLGDRLLASLTLRNGADTAAQADVAVHAADGVRVDSVRLAGGATAGDIPRVTVPPRSDVIVQAQIEAARAGECGITFEARSGDSVIQRSGRFSVLDLPAQNSTQRDAWRVQREVILLTPERGLPPTDDLAPPAANPLARRFTRTILRDGDHVGPGQLILIRDEFEAPSAVSDLKWTQHAPATCHTIVTELGVFKPLRGRETKTLDSLTVEIPKLDRGRHTSEIVLCTVRPGAALVPPPAILVGGSAVPLIVSPAEIRIVVDEASED
ncbi:MAG: hypothetical protein U1D55_15235 [Phycisphaerae bacterium]